GGFARYCLTPFKCSLYGLSESHGTAGWYGTDFFLRRGSATMARPCSDTSRLPLLFTGGIVGATPHRSFGDGFIKFTIAPSAWKSSRAFTNIHSRFCSIA